MRWLARVFSRTPPLQHVRDGELQHFITRTWRITLPHDWTLQHQERQALYFESSDHFAGIYVSLVKLHREKNLPLHEIAERLHASSRAGLCALRDYDWSLQQDEISTTRDSGTALLDAHDRERCYRLCTKTEIRPPYALRLAYHDMLCQNYAARRQRAHELFATARLTA